MRYPYRLKPRCLPYWLQLRIGGLQYRHLLSLHPEKSLFLPVLHDGLRNNLIGVGQGIKCIIFQLRDASADLYIGLLHDVEDNVERIIISLHHFVDAGIDIFAGFLIIVSKSSNFFNFLFISYNIVTKYHKCFVVQFFP